MRKPVAIPLTPASRNRPSTDRPAPPKRWTFSFRYWKEIEYFGLSETKSKWFVSLMERLGELSKLEIDRFLADQPEKAAWRYHDINWTQQNIPIQLKDLDWIDACYLRNPEEFPLVQFMVSKTLGRIVGFWDENQVFNIVLLDPLHNIQPTKKFSYRVDKCFPLGCEYTELLLQIEKVKAQECNGENCPAYSALQQPLSTSLQANVVLIQIDDGLMNDASLLMEQDKTLTLVSLLEFGILYKLDKDSPN